MASEVVKLVQFVEDGCSIGLSKNEVEFIADQVAKAPILGHAYVGIEPKKIPMSGFFGRSWKFKRPGWALGGNAIECTSLHLYLGPDHPLYLWGLAALPEYSAPWNNEGEKRLLLELGREVLNVLTAVQAMDGA